MRAATEKTVSKNGTQSSTTHRSWYPKKTPATVAVITRDGSTSAAPVTIPGRTRFRNVVRAYEVNSRRSLGSGHVSTLPRLSTVPVRGSELSRRLGSKFRSRNFGKLIPQPLLDRVFAHQPPGTPI